MLAYTQKPVKVKQRRLRGKADENADSDRNGDRDGDVGAEG